jgi:hypothetical protein
MHTVKILLTAAGVGLAAFLVAAYFLTALFVIQPIGAVPDGVTLWVWRGEKMRFFDSADGVCLRTTGSVSLLCRMAALGAVASGRDRIIARLPYSERIYLWSTDGQVFER